MLIKSRMLGGLLGAALPCLTAANAAELPDAVAADPSAGACGRRADLRVQSRCGRQARVAIPRADCLALQRGKTIGRHYAGPNWEIEGSGVAAKAVGRAPGATSKDIPWLKLDM